FSIPHCIPDDEAARLTVQRPMERVPSGSYLAISHLMAESLATAEELNATAGGQGLEMKVRTPDALDAWLRDLEPVDPGLGDIVNWRPDSDQPPLPPTPEELKPFEGASHLSKSFFEYGGVLRKP
ncbi:SAM-dependent methyltransferase, partial [Halostreptopolyspora alba]|uniref:SAM-dependent methyltransferase n=1 Tax=Halostreptopolyspora alba TaxID=2487137 RepID=UPI0037167024